MLFSQYLEYEAQRRNKIAQLKQQYDTFKTTVLDTPILYECIKHYLLNNLNMFPCDALFEARILGHRIEYTEHQLTITLDGLTTLPKQAYSLDFRRGQKVDTGEPVLDVFLYQPALAVTGNSEMRENLAKIKWNRQKNKLRWFFNPAQYVEKTVYAGIKEAEKERASYSLIANSIKCKKTTGHGVYQKQKEYGRTGVLIMQHGGQDLKSLLKPTTSPALSTNDRWLLGLEGLFTARDQLVRRKIVHRDIKPANYLVDPTKNRFTLCDFGSAYSFANPCETPTSYTPGYISPEAIPYCFNGDYDNPSGTPILSRQPTMASYSQDIFSLGMTLMEILGGKSANDKLRKYIKTSPIPAWFIETAKRKYDRKEYPVDYFFVMNAIYLYEATQPEQADWELNPFKAHGIFSLDPSITDEEKNKLIELLETMVHPDPSKRPDIDDVIYTYTLQYKAWIRQHILPTLEAMAQLFPRQQVPNSNSESADYSQFTGMVHTLKNRIMAILSQSNTVDLTESQLNYIALASFVNDSLKSEAPLEPDAKQHYALKLINTTLLPYLQYALSKEIDQLNKKKKRIPATSLEYTYLPTIIDFLLLELQEIQNQYDANPTNNIATLNNRISHYSQARKVIGKLRSMPNTANNAVIEEIRSNDTFVHSPFSSINLFVRYSTAKNSLAQKIADLVAKYRYHTSIEKENAPVLMDTIYFLLQELQEKQRHDEANPPHNMAEAEQYTAHYEHAIRMVDAFLSDITATETAIISQEIRQSALKSVAYFVAYCDCDAKISEHTVNNNKQRPTLNELETLNQLLTQSIQVLKCLLAYYQRQENAPVYETNSIPTLEVAIQQLEDKQKNSNDLRTWFADPHKQYDARRQDPKALLQLVNEYREMISFATDTHTCVQYLVTSRRNHYKNMHSTTIEKNTPLDTFCRSPLYPTALHDHVEKYINTYKHSYNLKIFTHYAAHIVLTAAAFSTVAAVLGGPLGIAVAAATGCVMGYYLARQTFWQRPLTPPTMTEANVSTTPLVR